MIRTSANAKTKFKFLPKVSAWNFPTKFLSINYINNQRTDEPEIRQASKKQASNTFPKSSSHRWLSSTRHIIEQAPENLSIRDINDSVKL